MKCVVFLFLAVIIYTNLSAQNVGIGTNTPTQKLDVVGNLRVSGSVMPGGFPGSPGQVLTSSGNGIAPTWTERIPLPFNGISNSAGAGFQISQTGNGPTGNFSISNPSNPNSVIRAITNGIGFAANFVSSNATPKALHTSGGVRLENIGEGEGKVLVSDANGNATWDGPVAFMGYFANDAFIPSGILWMFGSLIEELDEGNNLVSGVFTAPKNGIYHFDASVKWGTNNSAANYSQASIEKCDNAGNNCEKLASSKINNQVATQLFLSVNVKLLAGEKVKLFTFQTNTDASTRGLEGKDANGPNPTDGNIPTFFSGHLVR